MLIALSNNADKYCILFFVSFVFSFIFLHFSVCWATKSRFWKALRKWNTRQKQVYPCLSTKPQNTAYRGGAS